MKKKKKITITLSEISISIYSFFFTLIIVILLTRIFFGYNKDFFQNIAVEAHGMIMDIAVIGVLSLWLNNKVRKKDINRGYLEQIDDFRYWKSEEASFRIAGLIKRLYRNNEKKINLHQCYINGIRLESVSFEKSICFQTNFSDSTLKNINFIKCTLKGSAFTNATVSNIHFIKCYMRIVNFTNAKMIGTVFDNCDLVRADFKNSILKNSIFTNSDIDGATFQGADLENANFMYVKNLKIEQLLEASVIKYIKLNTEMYCEIEKKYPNKVKKYMDKSDLCHYQIL